MQVRSTEISLKPSHKNLSAAYNYSLCQIGRRLNYFTFFYSTDLDPATFQRVRNTIYHGLAQRYYDSVWTGLARIDTKTPATWDGEQNIRDIFQFVDSHPPNATLAADPSVPSQFVSLFQNLMSQYWWETSICIFLLNRLPAINEDLTDDSYKTLLNQNRKTFILIPKPALNYPGRSVLALNRMATITNGHVIIVNDPALSDDYQTDYNNIVAKIMEFGQNGNLMLSRSLGAKALNSDLGVIMVPGSDKDLIKVTVTITTAYQDSTTLSPATISVLFTDKNGKHLNKTVDCTEDYHGSNFYYGSVNLERDSEFQVFLNYKGDSTDLLIRIWNYIIIRDHVSIKGYNTKDTINPNEHDGAWPYVQTYCRGEDAHLIITDCNGQVSKKYDARQMLPSQYAIRTQPPDSFPSYFLTPFFCDSQLKSTCVIGAQNKYDVQFRTGRVALARSFICDPAVGSLNPNCTQTDPNGNYYCKRDTLPYKRGPLGQLTDCLGRGFLAYGYPESRDFRCICNPGYTGVSCENQI